MLNAVHIAPVTARDCGHETPAAHRQDHLSTGADTVGGRRAVRGGVAAAALALLLSACASGAGQTPAATESTPSASSPAQSEPPSTPAGEATPCGFTGQDLTDYTSIVDSFESYFGNLNGVLEFGYSATAESRAPLLASAADLVSRLREGRLTGDDGAMAIMGNIQTLVSGLFQSGLTPIAPESMPQSEIENALVRMGERLQALEGACAQQLST